MAAHDLLPEYLNGPAKLRGAISGLTPDQLTSRPVPGKWSILEVLCHLADSDSLFADRMKRILAENQPLLPVSDPDLHVPALAYQQRAPEVELQILDLTRRQMASILRTVPPEAFARTGIHSVNGECTLQQVFEKAIWHLDHHLKFIDEKRQAMTSQEGGT